MAIKATALIMDDNESIGELYGGELLTQNYETVDEVKDVVYGGERHRERDTGTTTISLKALPVSI